MRRLRMLKDRTDVIEEILETSSAKLTVLRQLLRGLPDLARGLCRIQYGKVQLFAEIPQYVSE